MPYADKASASSKRKKDKKDKKDSKNMAQIVFTKLIGKPARKKGATAGSSTQFPATVEDHAKSRSIRNPWNCFLLEAKAIRDYFVQEEAPSQGSTASDPAFFNSLRF